jgi:hypothetical protein
MARLLSPLLLSVCLFVCLVSCKKDSEQFLKRNTDHLQFSYTESSARFTVRATGPWYIEIPAQYSWIQVSPQEGVGDGNTYQEVVVTCMNNTGDAREGYIYLNGGGQKQVPIKIEQANGVFEWLRYDNGSRLGLSNTLVVNTPSSASIRVPYIKASGQEQVTVSVSISGKGSDGLSVSSTSFTLAQGDGYLEIPIEGTPSTQGEVNLQVSVNGTDFGTVSTVALVGQTLVEQRFDKFLWGGDCIANKPGVTTTQPTASMTLADETTACAVGTNGANGSGVTSTIRTSNPAFYKEIEMEDWRGVRNYMRPGYIQLGATSATADEYGSLITPGLDLPAGTHDLLVEFKLGIYNAPYPDKMVVGLIPKGTDLLRISNYSTITNRAQVPVDFPAYKWVSYSCVIKNATNASSVVIALPEELNQGGAVQASRIYVDDIKVTY